MGIELPAYGFVVGILIGLTGMGGGAIMTPLLIIALGIHPTVAVGTDLLYAAATKSVGALVHSRKGNVSWPIVGRMAAGSVPGALLTVTVLAHLPLRGAEVGRALTVAIGVALFAVGLSLLRMRKNSRAVTEGGEDGEAAAAGLGARRRLAATIVLGFLLGVLVSLTSVGSGALGLVILRQLYPELPSVRLVGTDIGHAIPLTLLAGSGHWLIGDVDWALLGMLLAGSVPGIVIGSHYAHHLPERIMRPLLGAVLVAIAVALVVG